VGRFLIIWYPAGHKRWVVFYMPPESGNWENKADQRLFQNSKFFIVDPLTSEIITSILLIIRIFSDRDVK